MPITVEEKPGRRLSDHRAELVYIVRGTEDAGDARAAVLGAAPSIYEGQALDDVDLDEIEGLSGGGYLASVRYAAPRWVQSEPQEGDQSFSFDTGGATVHVTQSLATRHYPDAAGTPRFNGAINVTDHGVEGVQIDAPAFTFEITFTKAAIDAAYVRGLMEADKKVNSDNVTLTIEDGTTISFAAGELRLLQTRGERRGDGPWQITARFAASPNRTGLTVGTITGVDKLGHEYLWVLYDEVEDTDAQRVLKKPVQVYVEQVYETTPFTGLFGSPA
jgi:hypothetical protein